MRGSGEKRAHQRLHKRMHSFHSESEVCAYSDKVPTSTAAVSSSRPPHHRSTASDLPVTSYQNLNLPAAACVSSIFCTGKKAFSLDPALAISLEFPLNDISSPAKTVDCNVPVPEFITFYTEPAIALSSSSSSSSSSSASNSPEARTSDLTTTLPLPISPGYERRGRFLIWPVGTASPFDLALVDTKQQQRSW